jgi:dihydrodipicolinate synthase/N-acetylneuraminate lyase
MLMVLPPDWGGSSTPRTLTDHYAAVAEHIPVMVVTNVFIPRGMAFGLETLKTVFREVKGVYAVKDDWCGEFARKMSLLVHERWAVLSGGQKQNHLNNLFYGCDGYLSTFINFKPEVARNYWNTIQANNLTKARDIIRDYDLPYGDLISSFPGGFDAGIHGTLEIFGIAKRWRRKPYYNLNEEEMEKLKEFLVKRCLV